MFRLTIPEALIDGFRWTTSAHSSPAAPVELLSDRHEVGTEETGNIGTRILLFRMNEVGSHTIYLDYVKFTA